MQRLSAENIGVRVEERTLLDGVSLTVRAGEFVGLIGPNGAGKTTLMRVMARLLTPSAGSVELDGEALATMAPQRVARQLGYLAQGAPAHWPLSVETVVALGRLPHLRWWQRPTASDRARIDQAMRAAEVGYLRDRLVTTLSGGERLRVLLARVFAAEPSLILADEPIAALDPYHQLHVMELLREHAHPRDGRPAGAVVAVLHDLNLAARFCDRLVLLAGGKSVCQGPVRDVLDSDHLRDVYGVEAKVIDMNGEYGVVPWRRVRRDAE